MSNATQDDGASDVLRVLTLDGGGAKGFYTLGVLKEIEAMVQCPLHQKFDLVFGTSTGAIIASLIALGHSVDAILELYRNHVPNVMSRKTAPARSAALKTLTSEVFGDAKFGEVKTGIGVVTAKWLTERPMIFKGSVFQAHGRVGTFVPGFGVSIADAVKASCSAYPFFERTIVRTSTGENIELIDGGYCANNPTLYAIADAVQALKRERNDIRLVSLGVGIYPEPKPGLLMWLAKNISSASNCFRRPWKSIRSLWTSCARFCSMTCRPSGSATPMSRPRWPPIYWNTISRSLTSFSSAGGSRSPLVKSSFASI